MMRRQESGDRESVMKTRLLSIFGLSLAFGLAGWAAVVPPPASAQGRTHNGVILGAFVSGDRDNFIALEKQLGRVLAIDFTYKQWAWSDGLSRQVWDIQQGRTPLIAWSAKLNGKGTCVTAADIAAGKYDAQLKMQAKAMKSLGSKVLIDFIPEMTDRKIGMDCFYGAAWSADDAGIARAGAAYAAAQHHVVGIFRASGATNAEWVFAPDGQPFKNRGGGTPEWTRFYPGSAWVDWIGVDHHIGPGRRKAFPDHLLSKFYRETESYGKPLMLAQTAADPDPSVQPDAQTLWLSGAEAAIPKQFPAIHAVIYNDHGKRNQHMLSGAGLAAFKAMANDPYFAAR